MLNTILGQRELTLWKLKFKFPKLSKVDILECVELTQYVEIDWRK